jgi:hypothetical protein
MMTSSPNDKEAETMRRSISRSIAVAVVSIAISMFVSAGLPAQAAEGPVNCVSQTHQGACYEFVWVDGVEVRMTFAQAGHPLSHIPNAKVQNFYVVAPQTETPQGDIPPIHDHTIQAAPGDPDWTPFMHGYFVLCSAVGLTSGDCVATFTEFPGVGTLPLAKSVDGEPLTSAKTIEGGIDAGLLVAVDTGAVLIGTVSPAR